MTHTKRLRLGPNVFFYTSTLSERSDNSAVYRGAGFSGKMASYYSEMLLGMWLGCVFSPVISYSLHDDHSIIVKFARVSMWQQK